MSITRRDSIGKNSIGVVNYPQTHGLYGYRDGLRWDAHMSVPGILSQEGYQTELIGKLHLYPQRKRYGFDHMIRTESPNDRWNITVQSVNDWVDALKQQGVIEHPNNIGIFGNGRVGRPLDIDEQYHHTSWLSDRVVDFMTKYRDPNCPYFSHLSYWAPHPPLIPLQAYWDRYAEHGMCPQLGDWTPDLPYQLGVPDDSALGPFSEREMAQAIRGYYGLINWMIEFVGFCFVLLGVVLNDKKNRP